jgi:cytochrome c-type biogenesis protein CcmE
MKPKYKRLKLIFIMIICTSLGLWLILSNFNDNIVFFFSPTELKSHPTNQIIRVGGLVESNSIKKHHNLVEFKITDQQNDLIIHYEGILPNLFREGQGIVAKGRLKEDIFIADELLAKHDENYMPKEVAKALKESGNWRESE